MILLIGHSAAGKTTIEKELHKQGFDRIISYTSRPMREGEINGIDYHFISETEFLYGLENGFFSESTNYRGWHYGIAKKDCKNDAIATVEPVGFRMLKQIDGLSITSFYIKVNERTRLIRMAKRGDEIGELFRRLFSDQGSFNGIENEVNFIIENEDGLLEEAIQKIINIIKENL
jgi:guanylate kinase